MYDKINIDTRIKKCNDIITIDPYNNKYYLFDKEKKTIEDKKKLSYQKKNYTITYIRELDFIFTTFDIGIHNQSDILDIFYRRAIEELSLDEEKEYVIKYEEVDNVNNPGVYNVFIIESLTLDNAIASIALKTQFLDLVLVFPLLFKTLYEHSYLKPDGNDCFLHMSEDNTSIAIYSEGNFLYSKSIPYSLNNIYEKYCVQVSEKIEEKDFFEKFENGLKSTDIDFQKNILKIFSEIFLQINDIIIYAKRIFELETMNRIFLGSVNGSILGLVDYSNNFLGIPSFNFDFDFKFKHKKWYIDQIQYLLILNGLDYIKNNRNILNLTTYKRSPLFVNRASGQLIITMSVFIFLTFIWALIYIIITKTTNANFKSLETENQILEREVKSYKTRIANKKEELANFLVKKEDIEKKLTIKNQTLNFIFKIKVNYKFKSTIFHQIAIDILKFNLRLEKIESTNNTFNLSIISSNNSNITEYINYISSKYINTISDINLEMISKNSILIDNKSDNTKLDNKYRSILKVVYK